MGREIGQLLHAVKYAVRLAKSLELLHHCSQPVLHQLQNMTFARFYFYFYFSYSSPKAVEKR